MGKFTDDFFVFPIKIYDGFSLKKAMEQEGKEDTDTPVPIDWIVGHVRIPARDLHKIVWHDGFSRERTVGDVAEKGFDLTIVSSDIYGEFICTWSRKKFEAKLDEFMEQWETRMMQDAQAMTGFMAISSLPELSKNGEEEKS